MDVELTSILTERCFLRMVTQDFASTRSVTFTFLLLLSEWTYYDIAYVSSVFM